MFEIQGLSNFEIILEKMSKCVNAKKRTFMNGETILSFGNKRKIIGIILSGNADLRKIDIKGFETILENLSKGDIFSEMFIEINDDPTYLVATKETEVLFIDYYHIFNDCKINCLNHKIVVNTIIDMLMHKTVQLSNKISILSNRTTREKILSYLQTEAKGNRKVTINYSLQELADYLCVDRSAMMREIKKLIDEKKIKKEGRTFTIYKR